MDVRFEAITQMMEQNNFEHLKTLVENKILNVHKIYESGYTPLTIAINSRAGKEIIQYLLSMNANPNASTTSGFTPLHLAIKKNLEIIELLLSYKANPNLADCRGNTPLMEAILLENIEFIKILLKHGAEVNLININHKSPLYMACELPNFEIVKLLIKHGADVNFATKFNGGTPLHLTASQIDRETVQIIKILKDNGARINASDNFGRTPLMIACSQVDFDTVKYLHSVGGNILAIDDKGDKPIDYARKTNKDSGLIEKYLNENEKVMYETVISSSEEEFSSSLGSSLSSSESSLVSALSISTPSTSVSFKSEFDM